jgi:hypothetical protein
MNVEPVRVWGGFSQLVVFEDCLVFEGPRALGGEALDGAQSDPGAAAGGDGNLSSTFLFMKVFCSLYGLCCLW